MSGRFGVLRYNCIGCNAPIAEDGTADHRPYCEYGPKQPDLLSLADALAEAARQAHEIAMRHYGVELPNLLAKATAWDAARKQGGKG